jgi:hypothetical protein
MPDISRPKTIQLVAHTDLRSQRRYNLFRLSVLLPSRRCGRIVLHPSSGWQRSFLPPKLVLVMRTIAYEVANTSPLNDCSEFIDRYFRSYTR